MTPAALHLLAACRGVLPADGSRCAVCGTSPYPVGCPVGERLGASFSDWSLLADSGAEYVCAGCATILSGKPGDDPPPVRCRWVLATEGAPLALLDRAGVRAVLLDPPAGPSVLVVGASRQRHACLHAGLSSRDRLLVGTDLGQATYSPVRHEPILRAVEDLRSGLPTTAILSGCYSSVGVAHFGASAWQARERVIAPWRGDPVLDLLCLVATKPETSPLLETSPMIDPSDAAASRLLYLIAAASSIRATDGKMFWSGFFRHRVQRFATLPLSDAVSRLLDAVHAAPAAESTQEALASLASLSAQEQTDIETALRRRAALCVALAYDQIHEARVRRTQRQSETLSEASASPAPALNLQASLFGAKQE